MSENKKVAVEGILILQGRQTGKTEKIMETIRKYMKEGKTVSFVCFTRSDFHANMINDFMTNVGEYPGKLHLYYPNKNATEEMVSRIILDSLNNDNTNALIVEDLDVKFKDVLTNVEGWIDENNYPPTIVSMAS